MSFSPFIRLPLLCAVMLGVGGCAARKSMPPAAPPSAVQRPPAPTPEEIARLEATNAALVEARAELLARYATGVSDELWGNDAKSLEEYYLAASLNPADEPLVMEVSFRLLRAQRLEKALTLLEQAVTQPTVSAEMLAHYGRVCQMAGKRAEAIAASQKAISLNPTNITGYQTLVAIHLKDQQTNAVRQALEQAARQPGDAVFEIELAEMFLNYLQQAPDQSADLKPRVAALLDRARELKPEAVGYQLKLADLYAAAGENQRAVEQFLRIQEQFAQVPLIRDNVRAKLTALYLQGQDRPKAMAQLEAIIKDYPLNAQAYFFLGGLAFEEKQYARAAELFSKTILLNPEFEQGYYDAAIAMINTNQAKEALQVLDQARQKFPASFALEYFTGVAQMRLKNYAEAIKAFTAAEVIAGATDVERLTPSLYFQIGAAMERLKRYEAAESYFNRAIDLDPNFAEALNYLAYMWAERGINLDRAQAMLEKALRLEPKNAAFLDSMGWVYFKLGNYPRALEYVQKAVALSDEPDATLHDHLGDIFFALKQWDKAREQWEKSLKIEPSDEIKKKLETAPRN